MSELLRQQSSRSFIAASGRLPWFDTSGDLLPPYFLGIAGGSASGKTSVASRIIHELGVPWVVLLSMDSFYKVLNKEQSELARANNYNFDHPDAFDYDLMVETLTNLKKGIKVNVPIYDFTTHSRIEDTTTVYGANVVIFEGIFALYDERVRNMMDMKLFVDTDDDVRLARRLHRDITERGRDKFGVLEQYRRFVKPSFDSHIYPQMKHADVILPRGLDNVAAISLITKHISRQLKERGTALRTSLSQIEALHAISPLITVLDNKPHLIALHTIIRNAETQRDDFIFAAERLARIIVEKAIGCLPSTDLDVVTPTGATYNGKCHSQQLCAVSIVRAGVFFEQSLRQCIKDIRLGKLLIQTDLVRGEPQLHYCKLPEMSDSHVFVVDAQIATGAAALMAIRVILDHGVPQDRIIFLALLASPTGLHAITHAFPRVKIVVSAVDSVLNNDTLYITPGFGNFANRYFGTSME